MTKPQKFRDQSIEELQLAVVNERKKLFKLENERQENKTLERPHRIRESKKDIARLLTIISEKQAKTHQA